MRLSDSEEERQPEKTHGRRAVEDEPEIVLKDKHRKKDKKKRRHIEDDDDEFNGLTLDQINEKIAQYQNPDYKPKKHHKKRDKSPSPEQIVETKKEDHDEEEK